LRVVLFLFAVILAVVIIVKRICIRIARGIGQRNAGRITLNAAHHVNSSFLSSLFFSLNNSLWEDTIPYDSASGVMYCLARLTALAAS